MVEIRSLLSILFDTPNAWIIRCFAYIHPRDHKSTKGDECEDAVH